MRLRRAEAVLKLDVDQPRRLPLREILAKLGRAGYELLALGESRSPGGKGWHYWLHVHPAPRSAMEVVALQAILGSDVYREACVLRRAQSLGRVPSFARAWWNVLYRSHPARGRHTLRGAL